MELLRLEFASYFAAKREEFAGGNTQTYKRYITEQRREKVQKWGEKTRMRTKFTATWRLVQ